jgi:cyclophilin family peptidyl-prolyl cis-trans isomerase
MKKQQWISAVFGLATIATLAGCGAASNSTATPANNSQNTTTQVTNTADNTTAGTNSTDNSSAAPQTLNGKMQWSTPPAMQIDVHKTYDAVFHTNYGNFTIQLFASQSPHTVNNFVFLARHQFYNGDKFFRIIQPFMIQTGDPTNQGTGGPGYQFADELPVKQPYSPGIVAMANAGANTNGSQFFICTGAQSSGLNQSPNYTQFGKVISGMKSVLAIAAVPVTTNPQSGEDSSPTKNAVIESVTIVTH